VETTGDWRQWRPLETEETTGDSGDSGDHRSSIFVADKAYFVILI